jgi:pilus assembly protein Flp/PilA
MLIAVLHAACSLPHRCEEGIPMQKFLGSVKKFLVSEDGPTAVEYAVMLALIVIVCLTAIQAIGTNANVTFNSVASKLGTTGSS